MQKKRNKKNKPLPPLEFKRHIEILYHNPTVSVELWNEPDGPHILIIADDLPRTERFNLETRLQRKAKTAQ